jgi:hypothetical protein
VSTSEPWRRPGTSEITDRQRLASVGCLTDPVELSKSNLVGHWHYESGTKPNAQGTLVVWRSGCIKAGSSSPEFANPSTLLREKVEWSRRGVMVIGNGLAEDQSS